MSRIPDDILARIAARAQDPRRRTFMAGALASATRLDIGSLLSDFQSNGSLQAQGLAGALGILQNLTGAAGGISVIGPNNAQFPGDSAPAGPRPLSGPPGDGLLSGAAGQIGRPLPEELRQLYSIADGGFGPGDGLFPVAEVVERYHYLTREPFGPLGQDWPKTLLPLFLEDPVLVCLDMESGEIVAWDPEEIEDEESDDDWRRAFKREQPSLAALMTAWLGEPTFQEQSQAERAAAYANVPQATLDYYAAMTPEQRDKYGLAGDNWEAELRRRFAAGPGGA